MIYDLYLFVYCAFMYIYTDISLVKKYYFLAYTVFSRFQGIRVSSTEN